MISDTMIFSLSTTPSTSATILPSFPTTTTPLTTTSSTKLNDSSTAISDESDLTKCQYYPPAYLEERFWLVTVVGTSVALISVVENLFLFYILIKKKSNRNSHCLYLILLAFFDVFMGAAYIPLMSLSLLLDYLESVLLLRSWYSYMTPLITTSHIAMTSSSFLILAVSFERFCITCWTSKVKTVNKFRRYIAISAICFGFITKSTLAGEFEISFNAECVGTMLEYSLKLSPLALDYYYNLFWRLGFRNVVTVLFPFFLLLIMNLKIVTVLRNSSQFSIHSQKINEVQRKRRVRAATRTLLMLVFTYLMANILNVVLTFWEYIDIRSLTGQFIAIYTFGVDTVSILTILAGALRLPIYVSCMPQMRKEIFACIKRSRGAAKIYKKQINALEYASKMPIYGVNFNFSANSSSLFYAPSILNASEMFLKLPRYISPSTVNWNSAKNVTLVNSLPSQRLYTSSDEEYYEEDEEDEDEMYLDSLVLNQLTMEKTLCPCATIASSTGKIPNSQTLFLESNLMENFADYSDNANKLLVKFFMDSLLPSLNIIATNVNEFNENKFFEANNNYNSANETQLNFTGFKSAEFMPFNKSSPLIAPNFDTSQSEDQRQKSYSSSYSSLSLFCIYAPVSNMISLSASSSASTNTASVSLKTGSTKENKANFLQNTSLPLSKSDLLGKKFNIFSNDIFFNQIRSIKIDDSSEVFL